MRNLLSTAVAAIVGLALVVIGTPSLLRAQAAVPEIDPTTSIAAVALLACVVMLIWEQRNTSRE